MVVVAFGKEPPLDGLLQPSGFQLFESLQLIKPLDEQQIGDLLDDFQRIGNSPGPEGIPDLINLVTNFVRQHNMCSLELFLELPGICARRSGKAGSGRKQTATNNIEDKAERIKEKSNVFVGRKKSGMMKVKAEIKNRDSCPKKNVIVELKNKAEIRKAENGN